MDKILEWWGEDRYFSTLDRIERFWQGTGSDRFLVSIQSSQYAYRQKFDKDKILQLVPKNLEAQAKLPGVNLPAFSPDFGTISTAKYWGGSYGFDSTGGNIFIRPVQDHLDHLDALNPLPVDDPSMDAYKAIEIYHALSDMLQTDHLWLRTSDMQGVLNTAGLIVNQEELWMAMLSEPEKVTPFLDKVTEFLIRYAMYFRSQSNNKVCGNIWPYSALPSSIGWSITEDMMPLMSADLYRDFGLPYLRRISEAMGQLLVHCCGQYARHVPNIISSGIEFAGFEHHESFTSLESLRQLWGKTVLIPVSGAGFNHSAEYFEYCLSNTPSDTRFWFFFFDESESAVSFAKKYGF